MKSENLVSIVIPIYNTQQYLDRCIKSVINQTYKSLEIILVDDGSPDDCHKICDEWAKKDGRIKVIHKQNQGLGMARNTGIDNATGDYICFFDSDDYVAPDTIEKCVAAAFAHNADVVAFGHDDVLPDGRVIATHIPCSDSRLFCGKEIVEFLLPMCLSSNVRSYENWDLTFSAWNKLFSLSVIQNAGWRFVSEREIISEDFYSLTELYGQINRVYLLNDVLYHYMVNQASLSRSYRSDRFEKIKGFNAAMISLCEEMGIIELLKQPIAEVTFGFSIGAIKQIVAADFSLKRRYGELKRVVRDDTLQQVLKTISYKEFNIKKRMLHSAIKHKTVWLCFLLVHLKNKRDVKY